ncbi:MAG: (d)CMP kinase [Bulleidia sp.]
MKINIAIDGPSAAGKSTIAKRLAKRLNYVHLDTGAMYRCTGLKAVNSGISFDDEDALCTMLAATDITLTPEGLVYLDGQDVSAKIRTDEISLAASAVSRHPGVRKVLVERQKQMAEDGGFIMDGRDIGTVVLKDAKVKIFMTASASARAKRRYDQNKAAGIPSESLEEITREIEQRDYQDTHRSASPLVRAQDAVEIDTSDMTIEEVCERIYALALPWIQEGK